MGRCKRGSRLPLRAGTDVTTVCPRQDTATLLRLVRPYVARLAECWGKPVDALLRLMDIPEIATVNVLACILMSCRGHGIGLEDDYGANMDVAEAKLGRPIDASPFLSECTEFGELAAAVVDAELLKQDYERDLNAPFQRGDRVRIKSTRLPTGDRLDGTGTVIRFHRAQQRVVVTLEEHVDPWAYSGRTVLVEPDDCTRLNTDVDARVSLGSTSREEWTRCRRSSTS